MFSSTGWRGELEGAGRKDSSYCQARPRHWRCLLAVSSTGGRWSTLVSLLSQLCGNQTKKLWKAILLCIVKELAGGGFEVVAVSVSDM